MKKESVITRLSNLDVQEVSIVTNGANKKQWYVTKSESAELEIAAGKRLLAATKGDVETVKAILRELLASLSDEALTELGLARVDPTVDTTTTEEPTDTTADPAIETTASDEEAAAETKANAEKAMGTIATLVKQIEELKIKLEKVSSVIVPSQTGGDPSPVQKSKPVESYSTVGCKPLR
jgi:hypothetical protein